MLHREGPRPYLLYPLFSWSKTRGYGDLLCPPLAGYFDEIGRDKPWEQKKSRLYWRGPTSGAWHGRGTPWRSTQRARLVQGQSVRLQAVKHGAGPSLTHTTGQLPMMTRATGWSLLQIRLHPTLFDASLVPLEMCTSSILTSLTPASQNNVMRTTGRAMCYDRNSDSRTRSKLTRTMITNTFLTSMAMARVKFSTAACENLRADVSGLLKHDIDIIFCVGDRVRSCSRAQSSLSGGANV